jgi:hypothetical protein
VASGIAIIVFLLLEFPRQKPFARGLTAILLSVGAAAILAQPAPAAAAIEPLRKAGAYAAFFLALGFLRDAAETSPLVRRCGLDLVSQPPGERAAALAGGTHLFAIILSYGAIELFGAMLSRTLDPCDEKARHAAMLAVYRGFSTTTAWSPLNIGMAVVLAAVPQAGWLDLVLPGFAFAMVALAFAMWLGGAPRRALRLDWAAHARLAGVVLLVFALAFAVEEAFAVRLVVGVTAVLPPLAMGWIALQARGAVVVRLRVVGQRLARQLRERVPTYRGEAAVLGGAGLAGTALAAAFPAAPLAALLDRMGVPGLLVLALIAPAMLLLAQLTLNPIIAVTLLAAILPPPAALGVTPMALGFAYLSGWAVCAGLTPMSASAITSARWAGHSDAGGGGAEVSPYDITNRWNLRFTGGQLLLAWAGLAMVA